MSKHKKSILIQTLKINATDGTNHNDIKIEDLHDVANN
jgi:hypothetical protein